MKYVDEQGEVQMLVADRHPFKGVKNYFTNSVLYQHLIKTGLDKEEPDSGNEADEVLELDNDFPWELDLSIIDQATLDVIDTTFGEDEWCLNEIEELAYLSACASDSICNDTCTGTILSESVEIEGDNVIWSAIDEFSPSQTPVKTSFLSKNWVYDMEGAFFKAPTHRNRKSQFSLVGLKLK